MKRALQAGAVVAALGGMVLASSCGGDGGTDPGPDTGRIEAEVTLDDAAAAGVTLRLFDPGASAPVSTQATSSSGAAVFSGLDAGGYEVEVEPPAGAEMAPADASRKSATVAAGGTATVSFDLVTSAGGGATREVVLTQNLTFSPSTLTIPVGTTVVWRNAAAIFHTVTPDGHSEWTRATLNQADQTFSHTFDEAGTYAYFCEPHRSAGMTGVITVE